MERWRERFASAVTRRSADAAHDLKTPLNIAVLNLELLQMRLGRLAGQDEKIAEYSRSIDQELRRIGRIVDTFFYCCTPPANEPCGPLEAYPVLHAEADRHGFEFATGDRSLVVTAHESRFRELAGLLFEGAAKIFRVPNAVVAAKETEDSLIVSIRGPVSESDRDLTKLFKLYCTDASGNPDLSLAAARLVAETYGGDLMLTEETGAVDLRLELPAGDR